MEESRVSLAVAGGVAHLRLCRDGAPHPIDPRWVSELGEAVARVKEYPGVRALLISAAGDVFSVGGDLPHFHGQVQRLDAELTDMVGPYHVTLGLLGALDVPVVCAVQGAVAGGGLGLLYTADVVIAADDTRLIPGFAELALSGDGGGSWWLPRLVGLARARELLLSNRTLTAAEALDWGLVTRVVARADLEKVAGETAATLAAGPTVAYAEMRRLLARSLTVGLDDQLSAELDAIVRCGTTADAVEGVRAFVERRTPRFQGK